MDSCSCGRQTYTLNVSLDRLLTGRLTLYSSLLSLGSSFVTCILRLFDSVLGVWNLSLGHYLNNHQWSLSCYNSCHLSSSWYSFNLSFSPSNIFALSNLLGCSLIAVSFNFPLSQLVLIIDVIGFRCRVYRLSPDYRIQSRFQMEFYLPSWKALSFTTTYSWEIAS